MNKNKIIFLVIGTLILIFFVVIFFVISNSGVKERNKSNTSNFSIWILKDDSTDFNEFLNDFKEKNEKYSNTNFDVVSFSDYSDYYYSLVGAFLRGEGPDIFVLNNSDSNFFDKQILGIDPALIGADDFRNNYDLVFSNDLIREIQINGEKVDYLTGIPMGYENLGIFYDFKIAKGKKLSTWNYIDDIIDDQRENNKVAIGIGNGSTVTGASDIISQFFLLEGMETLEGISGNEMKTAISNYVRFGDVNMENKYDSLKENLLFEGKNSLDAFSVGDIQMVVGYPSLLEEIDQKGYNKSFLRATIFPMYSENTGNLLVNYNYFAMSKNTKDVELAKSLIYYFSTEEGQKKYLEIFDYYLPSRLSLLESRLNEDLKEGYTIKYGDFYNENLELKTFNKGLSSMYDEKIPEILDSGTNSIDLFEIFRKKVLCTSSKMLSNENLQKSCE